MRRLRSVSIALAALLAVPVLASVGPAAASSVPSTSAESSSTSSSSATTSTLAPAASTSGTTVISTATRGSTIQLAPTLPPPTAPPTLAPSAPHPIPVYSGTGRRVVYSKGQMRVWIIEPGEVLVRTYLVSGKLSQPPYGTFFVFSRSSYTCNIDNPNICMRWMVRFTKGPTGDNIGFHEIPRKNGVPVQTESQLGQALSGGCVRQATADAWLMWNWAPIGTKVVVVP